MRTAQSLTLALALSTIAACGPSSTESSGDQPDAGDDSPLPGGDAGPTERCDKMDILFIIDDSGSMGQEQQNLAINFPQFINIIDSYGASNGAPLDYRVAVTTTGVSKEYTIPPFNFPGGQSGDDGTLLLGSGCNMPRRWLERDDPNVEDAFACVANVGTTGPSDEMPLEAMRLALTDRLADTNAGFLREDALLATVIVTDEEDCSRTDNNFSIGFGDICDNLSSVQSYISVVDTVKGNRARWATAVIAGLGPGQCTSELGNADHATRLTSFASLTGQNAVTSSICEGDLAGALQEALEKFDTACESFPPIE